MYYYFTIVILLLISIFGWIKGNREVSSIPSYDRMSKADIDLRRSGTKGYLLRNVSALAAVSVFVIQFFIPEDDTKNREMIAQCSLLMGKAAAEINESENINNFRENLLFFSEIMDRRLMQIDDDMGVDIQKTHDFLDSQVNIMNSRYSNPDYSIENNLKKCGKLATEIVENWCDNQSHLCIRY